jgi:hypothetical protein
MARQENVQDFQNGAFSTAPLVRKGAYGKKPVRIKHHGQRLMISSSHPVLASIQRTFRGGRLPSFRMSSGARPSGPRLVGQRKGCGHGICLQKARSKGRPPHQLSGPSSIRSPRPYYWGPTPVRLRQTRRRRGSARNGMSRSLRTQLSPMTLPRHRRVHAEQLLAVVDVNTRFDRRGALRSAAAGRRSIDRGIVDGNREGK